MTIFLGSRVTRFADNCYEWQISGKSHHLWPKNLLFTVTNVLFYFLHAILCPEHIIPLKQLSVADFAIVTKDDPFWLSIVMSPQLICDITRTWGTGIGTLYASIVLKIIFSEVRRNINELQIIDDQRGFENKKQLYSWYCTPGSKLVHHWSR